MKILNFSYLDFLRFFNFVFFGVFDRDLEGFLRSRDLERPFLSLDLDLDLEVELTLSRKFFGFPRCFLFFLFLRLFFLTSIDHDPDLASLSSFDLERLKRNGLNFLTREKNKQKVLKWLRRHKDPWRVKFKRGHSTPFRCRYHVGQTFSVILSFLSIICALNASK